MTTNSRYHSAFKVCNIIDIKNVSYDDSSDDEESNLTEEETDYESEQDALQNDEEYDEDLEFAANNTLSCTPSKRPRLSVFGRNKYKWSLSQLDCRQDKQWYKTQDYKIKNLIVGALKNPLEAFSLLLTEKMLDLMLDNTNNQIQIFREKTNQLPLDGSNDLLDMVELKAFIGLLIYAGVNNFNYKSLKQLWSPRGVVLFSATMSEERFLFINKNLRFDNSDTCTERKETDKFTDFREIWNMFIKNCQYFYEPALTVTVHQKLLNFDSKCPFKVYTQGKNNQYGIKMYIMSDATTKYFIDGVPYAGGALEEDKGTISIEDFTNLTKSIQNTGRRIICDKCYISLPLLDEMKAKYKLGILGVVKKNKPEIPVCFKKIPIQGNYQAAYSNDKILLSYVCKPSKIMLLLSSYHHNVAILPNGKLNIIHEYEKQKGDIREFECTSNMYSTRRKTKRWSVRMFYALLDYALMNSYMLYLTNVKDRNITKDEFMDNICMDLIRPALNRRLYDTRIEIHLRSNIEAIIGNPSNCLKKPKRERKTSFDDRLKERQKCGCCPISLNKTTTFKCVTCETPICAAHTYKCCEECLKMLSS